MYHVGAGLCSDLSLERTLNLWPSALQRLHCVEWNIKGDELAIACEDGVAYMYHVTLARVCGVCRSVVMRAR